MAIQQGGFFRQIGVPVQTHSDGTGSQYLAVGVNSYVKAIIAVPGPVAITPRFYANDTPGGDAVYSLLAYHYYNVSGTTTIDTYGAASRYVLSFTGAVMQDGATLELPTVGPDDILWLELSRLGTDDDDTLPVALWMQQFVVTPL